MAMPPISLQTQASSSASGRQDLAANFGKTINFGGSGMLSQAMPLMLLAVVGLLLLNRKKG